MTGTNRLRRWECLARAGARRRGPLVEIRYWPSRWAWLELEALVAAERVGCPFLSWSLRNERGWPVVRIEAAAGRSEDVASIAAMVGARADWPTPPVSAQPRSGCGSVQGCPDRRARASVNDVTGAGACCLASR